MGKRLLATFAISFLTALFNTGCLQGMMSAQHIPGGASNASIHPPDDQTQNSAEGRALYQQNCAACHGDASSSNKTRRTAAEIRAAIVAIPAMNRLSSLSSAQVNAIANFLNPANPPQQAVACNQPGQLLAPQVKRLTIAQFANSLRAAFGNIIPDSQLPNLGDANPRIGLAGDADHLAIHEINIRPLFEATTQISQTIIAQNSTVRNCVNGTDSSCFLNLAQNFGLQLWRRPLTQTESQAFTTELNTLASSSRNARMDFVLKSLIMSPLHLYRSEIGASSTPAQSAFLLTQYEVASLLAFTVWDSPPDQILFEQARLGRLHDKAVLRAQLNRMMQDPLFSRKMAGFTTDVLKIEDVKTVTKDASLGLTAADRQALYTSATTTLRDAYASPSADFMAPYYETRFHSNNLTARFFNISATGMTSSFQEFTPDPTQRSGILSHPAFLTVMSGEISSGIVRRGVYTLEQLLCNHLGSPPANAQAMSSIPEGFDPSRRSSREVLQITHSSQAACIGCHQKIDPAGFGFENYGPLGQFRTVEKTNIPIDASGNLSGVSARPILFSNSVGYLKALTETETMRSCMHRHFFKQTTGEGATTAAGACEFQNLEYGIAQGGNSVQALLESMVELESFVRRQPANL